MRRSWRTVTSAEVDAGLGRQHERAMFAYEAEQDRLEEMVSASETVSPDDPIVHGNRWREERNRYRALLDEFASHRVDSSLDWFDDWTRRVLATLDGGQS